MKKVFYFFLFSLIFKSSFSQEPDYKVVNTQQRKATYIVNQIQKNNLDSIYKYFDTDYLKNNNAKIKNTLAKFYLDHKSMNPLAKRDVTLVWPTGYNLFRFRYFDSTGTALQIDLAYKENDINSNIFLLETIDKETLKKQREASLKGPSAIQIGKTPAIKYPINKIIEYRNCNKEMRTITFDSQLKSIMNMVHGQANLETNKVLRFSPIYKIDSSFIRKNIIMVRNTLPKNFWDYSLRSKMLNHEPNEEVIWFMHLFSQTDKNGNTKILSGYKITFDGTNASEDKIRANPKIINVEFILDKAKLAALEKEIKTATGPTD